VKRNGFATNSPSVSWFPYLLPLMIVVEDMSRTKLSLFLLAVVVLAAATAGCAGTPTSVQANLGQEVSLSVGQTAVVQSQQLKIKFVEVVNDSRCPADVQCFWQGEANCLVEITLAQSVQRFVLTQPGLTGGLAAKDFNGYELHFKLEPYPQSAKTTAKGDYRLHLTITRG
jgi:hypothetical protein